MMWNSFVTSYRFILKSKTFTAINLIGLTAGLTASFFLLIYIINEFSYDSFHTKSNRIFRIITHTESTSIPFSPSLLPTRLMAGSEGIEKSGRILSLAYLIGEVSVDQQRNFVKAPGFMCADPEILDILTIPLLSGEGQTGLLSKHSVLLSESAALRCFGKTDPVGRNLKIMAGGIPDSLTVTGIFRDLPWNSTIQVDYLAGIDLFEEMMEQFGMDLESESRTYEDYYAEMFILTDRPGRIREIREGIPVLLDSLGLADQHVHYSFQNIRDIYLDSAKILNDFHQKGNPEALFYYGSLALFILLLAGINYSILSTARSALRFKEIGVRKILGATRRTLRIQILIESMMLTFLAFPLSFLVLGIIEPFVDKLYGYEIQLYTVNMLIYIPLFAGITLFIGFFSGAYLALYLSALNPLKAIKNQIYTRQRFNLSKIFIVFQLFITLSLLICMIIIFAQLHYCLNPDTGVRKDHLLIVPVDPEAFPYYPELRDETGKEASVLSLSGSSIIPPSDARTNITHKSSDTSTTTKFLETYYVDAGFFNTLNIEIVAGGDFNTTIDTGSLLLTVLNQEAVSALKLNNPVDTVLGPFKIVGVAEDFSIHSFYNEISPALFIYKPEWCQFMVVRYMPGTEAKTVAAIRQHWDKLAPGLPFVYSTYKDELNRMYNKEQKFSQVVASFAFLAFIITGMGLFGLALLISERRMKETAIRKVFGASNTDILFRMLKEFLIYIGIASLVAIPGTWFLMRYWLSAFYYQVGMHWYLFVIATASVTIFVSAIILLRTYRVLHQHPINALRYE